MKFEARARRSLSRQRAVSAVVAVALTAAYTPLGGVASAQVPAAAAAQRTSIMTRADYEACQARDEAQFKSAIEKLTEKGLTAGLAGVDYGRLTQEAWAKQNLDEVVDKLVDKAIDEVKNESSWGQLIGSLASKEKAQQLATAVAERVYKSDDMKRALEGLATDMGSALGKRIEAATAGTAEPAMQCLEAFLGPRYGSMVARVVSRDAGREYAVEPGSGQGTVSTGAVLAEGAGGLTGAVILLVRRQLAGMASRVGARIVGSVLSRLVSVAAGGVGLVLIAKDIWDFRHGVLPIISEEMKSKETKAKVQEELGKEVREQIGENVREIAAKTAERVVDVWGEFKKSHAKVLALAEKHPEFKAYLDRTKPDKLGRLDETVGLIAGIESDGAVLTRLANGSLQRIVSEWPQAAVDIARERKSVTLAEQWLAVAGVNTTRVAELELHKLGGPDQYTSESLAKLLALGDRPSILRLARLEVGQRKALLALGADETKKLSRALSDSEMASLGGYLAALPAQAGQRLLRAVATDPAQMKLFARSLTQKGILASADPYAAVGMILAPDAVPDPFALMRHMQLVTGRQVSPLLLWEKHPYVTGGFFAGFLIVLAVLRRLLFRPRPRIVARETVVVKETIAVPPTTATRAGKMLPQAPPIKTSG